MEGQDPLNLTATDLGEEEKFNPTAGASSDDENDVAPFQATRNRSTL